MSIIENILEIMQLKGITPYKLSKDIGISQATITHWKQGKQPTAERLQMIINYLEVQPNEIFGYQREEPRPFTQNEQELLEAFRKLPDREQIKWIGRMECAAEYTEKQEVVNHEH